MQRHPRKTAEDKDTDIKTHTGDSKGGDRGAETEKETEIRETGPQSAAACAAVHSVIYS